jgi:hypothetical protein
MSEDAVLGMTSQDVRVYAFYHNIDAGNELGSTEKGTEYAKYDANIGQSVRTKAKTGLEIGSAVHGSYSLISMQHCLGV